MKATLAIVFLVMLCLSSVVQAQQPFCASLWDTAFVLTSEEHGGTPLPDGTPVYVYWDQNLNGPDPSDSLPRVCDPPGSCEGTSYNFNTFTLNGTEMGFGAGRFLSPDYFCNFLGYPNPPHYYLKIETPQIVWISAVFICLPGPQAIQITNWSAESPPSQVCNPPSLITYMDPTVASGSRACLCLSPSAPGGVHTIYAGPILYGAACQARYPNGGWAPVEITPGCTSCGGDDCAPASGWQFDGHWDWSRQGNFFYLRAEIIMPEGSQAGCACVHLLPTNNGDLMDCWLPVSFGSFNAVGLDNAVKLSWNTLSETGLIRFEVLRDGTVLHTENATNTSIEHRYEFVDGSARNGLTYSYQLRAVNQDGSRQILATQSAAPTSSHASITEYALHQNYPNPFNPSTTISFDLLDAGQVSLKVYNLMGQEVASLVNRELSAGRHTVSFDGAALPSGVYLYRLTANNFVAEKKMLLMK